MKRKKWYFGKNKKFETEKRSLISSIQAYNKALQSKGIKSKFKPSNVGYTRSYNALESARAEFNQFKAQFSVSKNEIKTAKIQIEKIKQQGIEKARYTREQKTTFDYKRGQNLTAKEEKVLIEKLENKFKNNKEKLEKEFYKKQNEVNELRQKRAKEIEKLAKKGYAKHNEEYVKTTKDENEVLLNTKKLNEFKTAKAVYKYLFKMGHHNGYGQGQPPDKLKENLAKAILDQFPDKEWLADFVLKELKVEDVIFMFENTELNFGYIYGGEDGADARPIQIITSVIEKDDNLSKKLLKYQSAKEDIIEGKDKLEVEGGNYIAKMNNISPPKYKDDEYYNAIEKLKYDWKIKRNVGGEDRDEQ